MPEEVRGDIVDLPELRGGLRTLAAVGVAATVVIGIVLRFDTRSALWLDEALTVNIASLPLRSIPAALRHDGAPPLYYVLLHFWMRVFGTSDVATRALAGVIGVAALPVAWLAGRRFGGRSVAWVVLVLVASAPFAVFYSTEARMYELVILLTGCGFLALHRALERPRPGNLIATGVCVALLLYTQYWAEYLVAATALWLVVVIVAVHRRERGSGAWKRPASVLAAICVGALAFAPWLPIFLYQSKHTGTPWGGAANFAALTNAVTDFGANQGVLSTTATDQGRLLTLCYFGLAALALFGVGRSPRIVDLDLHTRPRARGLAIVIGVTLILAITGGLISSSTFSSRYAAVVFLPLLLLVAFGTTTLLHANGRAVVVTVAVLAGLAVSFQNIHTQRTQATQVAAVLNAQAKPGDVVAFCPDQLGPSVARLVTDSNRYDMVTYPRGTGPQIVDWADYAQAVDSTDPVAFAHHLLDRAGPAHTVWLVWEPGYQTYGVRCDLMASALQGAAGRSTSQPVASDSTEFYEPMILTKFARRPVDEALAKDATSVPILLTLCTGNAARSVMAGAMLRTAPLPVVTAGTHVIEGQPMSRRTRAAMESLGLSADHHRSHQVTPADFDTAVLIVAMAGEHVSYVRRKHPEAAGRVATAKRLVRDLPAGPEPLATRLAALDLARVEVEEWEDVEDPAGGDDALYVACAVELAGLCAELLPLLS